MEWGIQKASDQKIRSSLPDFEEDLPVAIGTTCPASIIHGDGTFEPGCWKSRVEESVHDVQAGLKLLQSVSIMLYIHGGVFVVGHSRDKSLCYPYSFLSQRSKEMRTRDACPPLNRASVKHRLATENTMSAGIDCLSAAKCMFESFPSSNVHISEFTWRHRSDLSPFGITPQERVKR